MRYRKKFEGVIISAKTGHVIRPGDLPICVHARFDDSRMRDKLTDENGRVEILGEPYGIGNLLEAVDFDRFEAMRSQFIKDLVEDILEGNPHPEIGIDIRKGEKGTWPNSSWTEEDILRLFSGEVANGTVKLLPCPRCGQGARIRAVLTEDGVHFVAGCDGCGLRSSDSARASTAAWGWNMMGDGRCGVEKRQEAVNPTVGTPIRQGTFEWVLSRMKFGPDLPWSSFRRKAWPEDVCMGWDKGAPAVFSPIYEGDGCRRIDKRITRPLTSEDLLAEDWTRVPEEGSWEWSFSESSDGR